MLKPLLECADKETRAAVVLAGRENMNARQIEDRKDDPNSARTAYEEGIPSASIQIHGDEWCVFGNVRLSNFVDYSLFFRERQVFGFPLVK
jgi:hypothetical protein